MTSPPEYIFVDLDGTLVRTDILYEAALIFLKRNPFNVFALAAWSLKGKAHLKHQLAARVKIDVTTLPYETALTDYIAEEKGKGRRVILATATHRVHADEVAAHLGCFDDVMATDERTNLKGRRKLEAIQAHVGDGEFCYAGNGPEDRPVWHSAASSILVNAPRRDIRSAQDRQHAEKIIRSRPSVARAFFKEMRVHQWAKNALIWVPLIASQRYDEPAAVFSAILAFLSFSICASGVYFLNDLLDLEADRLHERKRNRPLASGNLPILAGIAGAVLLPVAAFAIALATLPLLYSAILAGYFLLTNAYSFYLKRISTADVMTLSLLYTSRVFAGAAAIATPLSSWLVGFSVFVFVSLAYLKRYIELQALPDDDTQAAGRGYSPRDRETMFTLGIANSTASILVLALYITSDEVVTLYRTPELLWCLCFLMLYWANRVWIGARRGKINDDPVTFAIKDRVSLLIGVAFIAVVLLARMKF